jgi:gluconolactonase
MVFTEGPLWVRDGGYLLFSDVRGNALYKWAPGEGATDFIKPFFTGGREGTVGPNGLTRDSKRNLMICEHGDRRISRLALPKSGDRTTVLDNYQGKKLNSPNDLTYKSDGWLYFTDPPYGLTQQDDDPAKELDFNGIFRLSPDEKTLEVLAREQSRPNGIGFSPDEKTLYVSNSDPQKKVWMAYDVKADGTLENARVFYDVTSETAEGLPDGLKLDKQGNLYGTGPGGVWIFAPDGKHLGTIQPEEVPANVAWGDDGKTLYMTARTGLYRIRLSAEGRIP